MERATCRLSGDDENSLNFYWDVYTVVDLIKAHGIQCLNSVYYFTVYKPQKKKCICLVGSLFAL